MEAPLDLVAQEQGSGSCTKHTSLNNVRADRSQAAAAEVSVRFSFALTSVLGPAKSCQQQWLLTDAASMGDRKAIGNSGPQTGTTAGQGHLGSSAFLVGLRGGVYVILQAAWELCGLCIDDQMQIVPRGHSLFSSKFYCMAHTRTSWRECFNSLVVESHLKWGDAIKARQTVNDITFT